MTAGEMERQVDFDEVWLDRLAEDYTDSEEPYKIRKNKLMERVGLPVLATEYIAADDFAGLKSTLEEKLCEPGSIIIRLACKPDKLSMPVFYVNNREEIDEVVGDIAKFTAENSLVVVFLVQPATTEEQAKDKISGRLLFNESRYLPLDQVLELYKGARSTGILNNVEPGDKNFLQLQKDARGFLKPTTLIKDSSISEDELRRIDQQLERYKEQMEAARDIIALSRKKGSDQILVSFEFWWRDHQIFFTDLDEF